MKRITCLLLTVLFSVSAFALPVTGISSTTTRTTTNFRTAMETLSDLNSMKTNLVFENIRKQIQGLAVESVNLSRKLSLKKTSLTSSRITTISTRSRALWEYSQRINQLSLNFTQEQREDFLVELIENLQAQDHAGGINMSIPYTVPFTPPVYPAGGCSACLQNSGAITNRCVEGASRDHDCTNAYSEMVRDNYELASTMLWQGCMGSGNGDGARTADACLDRGIERANNCRNNHDDCSSDLEDFILWLEELLAYLDQLMDSLGDVVHEYDLALTQDWLTTRQYNLQNLNALQNFISSYQGILPPLP